MPRATMTFDTVRQLGLALPGTEKGTAYGSPALKVDGRMFTCIAIHKSAEPDTLAVRLSFKERDRLIAKDPTTYYLTNHYVNYLCVLVRLGKINRQALGRLIRHSWQFVSSGANLAPRARTAAHKR
jgi:hypothetical protein